MTHPRVLRHPWSSHAATEFLEAVAAAPGGTMLVQTDRHHDVLREIVQEMPRLAGNLWHDVETASLMREHGIHRICTRDTDFHRFPFVEAIDPMTSEP